MTIATPSKGSSVLASLTAEVMEAKKSAARKLTPVAGEAGAPAAPAPTPLPPTPAMFPNDQPTEVVAQKAAELTRIIAHLTEARDALLVLVEKPLPHEVVDPAAEQKAKEAQGDFNAKFRAQQEAAQEQVFVEPGGAAVALAEDMGVDEGETANGWTCPTHGKSIEKTSEKTGRTFIGCPDCNQFAR